MANLRRALGRHRAAELTIEPLIDTVVEFGTVVGAAAGKDYRLDNPRAVKFLRGYMVERVAMINTTTREELHQALKEPDPRAAVRAVFDKARSSRAEMIAETEVVRASNFAAVDAGKWVQVLDRKRWATRQDARVRHEHRGLHGQTVDWSARFKSPSGHTGPGPGSMSGGAAMNARCFPGETSVSPLGAVKKVFRRWYEGELVVLTFDDGRTLRMTPNHPLLGHRGWTHAGRLEDGDYLVREENLDGRLHLGQPQPDYVPMPLEEIYRLATMTGELHRIVGGTPDFHGDGREGHVDIVALDGEFRRGVEPPGSELIQQAFDGLAHTVQGPLAALRLLAGVYEGQRLASDSGVRGLGQSFAFLGGGVEHPVEHPRAAIAGIDPGLEQHASDYGPADAKLLGDGLLREILIEPSHLVLVKSKAVVRWSGHVFNLETASGYYSAMQVLCKNCRCSAVPVGAEVVEEFDRDPVELFDALRRPIERRMQRAWTRVFDEQEAAVLAELD